MTTALVVLAFVAFVGLLLATGHISLPSLPEEANGYPVPMILFAAIAVVGILVAGSV